MFEFTFIILAVLYALLSIKIDEWITISALGFSSETPRLFLETPRFYDVLRTILFLSTVGACFGLTEVPWYAGIGVLILVWMVVGLIGRNKAFNNYRKILREIAASAETPEDASRYELSSRKTDKELIEMVRLSMKYGI